MYFLRVTSRSSVLYTRQYEDIVRLPFATFVKCEGRDELGSGRLVPGPRSVADESSTDAKISVLEILSPRI